MYKFWLIFHWSSFVGVQLTIFQHCFRRWFGADQVTSHYLRQLWPRLVMHTCLLCLLLGCRAINCHGINLKFQQYSILSYGKINMSLGINVLRTPLADPICDWLAALLRVQGVKWLGSKVYEPIGIAGGQFQYKLSVIIQFHSKFFKINYHKSLKMLW